MITEMVLGRRMPRNNDDNILIIESCLLMDSRGQANTSIIGTDCKRVCF